jgi:hypothetical protein
MRQSLREPLRLLGILACENCSYDLRGSIDSARCPECGTPLHPAKLSDGAPAEAPDEQRGESVV